MVGMRIQASLEFPQDPVAAFAMLTDPAFLDAVCVATSPLEHSVFADGLRTGSRRVMENHPSIRRFTGSTITVTDEITWSATATAEGANGTALVRVEGMPVELVGTVVLGPLGGGSTLVYDGTLTVAVPLLGPGLEKQAAPLLLEALKRQEGVAAQWSQA